MGVWLHNFLVNRRQYIVSGDEISKSSDVISGIPQGTDLGPISFLIFISDIDKNINSIASMFCDDTQLMGKISNEEDVEKLQQDLTHIDSWAEENNMLFNNMKFELLRYGRDEEMKYSTFYLSANDAITEEKEQLRGLGIMVNNQTNFNDHLA